MKKLWAAVIFILTSKAFAMVPKQSLLIQDGDIGSGKILIPYELEGKKRQFVLDTGASFSHLNFDAETNSLPVTGSMSKAGAAGVKKTGDKVKVSKLQIGSLTLRNVEMGRFKDAKRDNLGNDLLIQTDRVIQLNISQKEILFPKKDPGYSHQTSFVMLPQGQIQVPVHFEKQDLHVIFDTGAELNSVDSAFVSANPTLFQFVQEISNGKDITGNKVVMKLYKAGSLEIAGVEIKLGNVIAFDFGQLRDYFGEHTPLILGVNSIRQKDWALDFKNKTLSFK